MRPPGKKITFRDALRAKLRYAAEYGQPFFALESLLAENRMPELSLPVLGRQPEWVVVVEGADDARTIQELLDRFVMQTKVVILPAGGQLSVASLAQHLKGTGSRNVAAIVTPIADAELQKEHLAELQASSAEVVALHQPLEDWLGNYVPVEYYNMTMMLTNRNGKNARRYARNLEVEKLLYATPSFSALVSKMHGRPKGE